MISRQSRARIIKTPAVDAHMNKYVTRQNITALARIAALCALAFISVGFSPAFAATLSRDLDVTAILSAMWSIGPFRVIRVWSPPFNA